jgi:hypothetical protein
LYSYYSFIKVDKRMFLRKTIILYVHNVYLYESFVLFVFWFH